MELAIIFTEKKGHETAIATGQQHSRFCQHLSRGDGGNRLKRSHQQQVQHP